MKQGRIIDIPYKDSPPLIFTYTQAASLSSGIYTFAPPTSGRTTFTPSRPIQPNVLYHFKTLDFAADIYEEDYMANVGNRPQFSMYLQSDSGAPALREPVPLPKYFRNLEYTCFILGSELLGDSYPGGTAPTVTQGFTYNRLLGNIDGTLSQTTPLIGKQTINAIVVLTVQEISDKEFIAEFYGRSKGSPAPGGMAPEMRSVF